MAEEYQILAGLVEKYWDSAKGRGENKVNRATKLDPKKIYNEYHIKTGDPKAKDNLEYAAKQCQDKGFVKLEYIPHREELQSIILIDDRVTDIEEYLANHYGYLSRSSKEQNLRNLIAKYSTECPLSKFACDKLQQDLDAHKINKHPYDDERDLLEALSFIGQNTKMLYLREASMKIFGSSKRFGGGEGEDDRKGKRLLNNVSMVCREFLGRERQDDEMDDEILQEFNIIQNVQTIGIKGHGKIEIRQEGRNTALDLSMNCIEIYVDALTEYPHIHIDTPIFMTVENQTSWLRLHDQNITYFNLKGFKDCTQRNFLKAVYRDNSEISYLHFGDIDAGGFRIYKDLCESTEIPFSMYKMSVEELADQQYAHCLQELTSEDQNRLRPFLELPEYQDVVAYMLDHNVKLEQEIISLSE